MTRRRRIAFALSAVALALGGTLVALEVFARLLDLRGISYHPETAAYLGTLIVDEPLGYRNRPGLVGTFYGARVEINALGFRGPEIAEAKAAGERRILVLGDSLPFGIGVEYADSIPALLEDLLNDGPHASVTFRTVNMGVPSYNTEQELTQLKTLGLALQPDAVTLLFMANDFYPRMWVFEKRNAWYTRLAQRSYAISLLFVLAREVYWSASGVSGGSPPGGYEPDTPGGQAIQRALTEMSRLCAEAEIPLVVFTVNGSYRVVDEVARREGFPVVRLAPAEDPRWRQIDPADYVNSPTDSHPNPRGSRFYATLIHESLVELGVVERLLARGS